MLQLRSAVKAFFKCRLEYSEVLEKVHLLVLFRHGASGAKVCFHNGSVGTIQGIGSHALLSTS